MFKKVVYFLLFTSLYLHTSTIFASPSYHAFQDSSFSDIYEKGLKLTKDHQSLQALNVWLTAKNFGKSPDPRIGIAFIQTATKNDLTKFYTEASEMYFWGLSGTKIKPFHDALFAELKRLQPLMSDDKYKNMRNLLDNNNPRFYNELSLFWETRDPMPSTPKNEYLITIWKRINYAQKHFKKGRYSAYGTDARGPVYIKYGKPDKNYKEQHANLNVKTTGNGNILNAIDTGSSGEQTVRYKLDGESPDIQFWIYNPETVHANRNVIYMFGTIPKKQQRYDIIRSLDELMPKGLTRNPGGGFHESVLQFRSRIYGEYRNIDPFFYHELINISPQGIGNTRTYAAQSRNRTAAVLEGRKAEAEPVISDEHIPDFSSGTTTYQFYNKQGLPYLVAALYSYPQKLVAAHSYNEAVVGASSKKILSHTLQIVDEDSATLQALKHVPDMDLSATMKGNKSFPFVSFFNLKDLPARTRLRSTAEIIAYDKERQGADQVSFLGLHSEIKKLDRQDSRSEWFISDAVIGYKNKDLKVHDNLFSFYPSPDRRIPHGKNLNVYFEVYDFNHQKSATESYRVSYSIDGKKGFLGNLFGKNSDQKVTLNLERSHSINANAIEIKTSGLPAGDYVLKLGVNSTGKKDIYKQIPFTIYQDCFVKSCIIKRK